MDHICGCLRAAGEPVEEAGIEDLKQAAAAYLADEGRLPPLLVKLLSEVGATLRACGLGQGVSAWHPGSLPEVAGREAAPF